MKPRHEYLRPGWDPNVKTATLGEARRAEHPVLARPGSGSAADTWSRQTRFPFTLRVAVQRDRVGLVVHPRTADVGGRGILEEFFFDRVLVEPGDGAQPPGDRAAGPAHGFQVPGEGLDVRAADREQGQGPGLAPGGELAQVQG
jgi:hypothetical protein